MQRRIWVMLLALLTVFSLMGCSKEKQEEPPPEPPPVYGPQAQEPEPEPEPEIPAGTNPLTGLPMEPEYEDNRPVAVMLNNLKAAQPQLGVSQADLIYEVPTEGGITRMLAVYQTLDNVGNLGSIRSTRPCFLELALGHDALLVHAGGSPSAYADIPAWGVDNLDGVRGQEDAKIFWRDPERQRTKGYEHSLLTSGENIQTYLDGSGLRTEHQADYQDAQTFAEDGTPVSGETAEHLTLRFTSYKTGTFDYDADAGRYLVGQYGNAYIDGSTGEQVGVTNVLILETSISVIPGDAEGRVSVKLTGSGNGTFFCGGKAMPIQWSKVDRNAPFVYTTENGTALKLGKGTTYICIVSPKTSTLSYH